MILAEFLDSDHILLDVKASEHWPVIEELVDHLATKDALSDLCRERVLELLRKREEQTSTGIGSGVAIPHAFCEDLDDMVCVFARSREGVEFHALDHAPVHFIVLFLVPTSQYAMHLQTLAAIAKMFKNSETRRQLHEADSRAEIMAVLGARPTSRAPRSKSPKSELPQ